MKATISLILRNLEASQRRELRDVILVAFAAALLELVTVASLYPLTRIAFLGDAPDGPIADIPATIGATSVRSVGLFWAGFILITVLVSLIVRLVALYRQSSFVQTVRHTTSRRIFATYLSQPYTYFLQRHSSELTKNTLQETDLYSVAGVNGLIGLAASLSTIIAALGLMLLFSPGGTIIFALVTVVLYILFYLGVSRRNVRAAFNRFEANKHRNFVVSESFAMFKELKANNSESYFINIFEPASLLFSKSVIVFDIIANLPRYFIETLLFGGVATAFGVTFLMMDEDVALGAALPTIAVVMGAMVRILPASQSLYRNLNSLRNCAPTVQNIAEVLALTPIPAEIEETAEALDFKSNIVFEEVSFRHEGTEQDSLTDLTLSIQRGAHVGILGETGSGKSTFLDLVMGLLEPSSGAIFVDNVRLGSAELPRWRRKIGYVPQQVVLTDGTIAQNIALGFETDDIDLDRVAYVAQLAQASEFIDKLPAGLQSQIGERGVQLSGGQRQRLCIARALYQEPEVLVFDEATSALDHETERRVIDAIRDSSASQTLIMVTHREDTLASCDQRITLVNGRLRSPSCGSVE